MATTEQISHLFLIFGVAAASVIPRQPSDGLGYWSVGGRLSHDFRKLLLATVAINLCRLFLSATGTSQLGSDLLGVVEVTGLTFLCFLTPYVLQRGLSEYLHITPGKSLKLPLYAAMILSFLGVTLSRFVHPNCWALKKLANAVSGPPVIEILRSYNMFTTHRSHGRGFVFAQTVMVIEYWHVVLQLGCALAYALNWADAPDTLWYRFLKATRSSAFIADWTRVLAHAMFLNQIDEMHHTTSGWGRSHDEEGGDASHHVSGADMVPLVSRTQSS